MDEMNNSKRLL